jgi:membrane protein
MAGKRSGSDLTRLHDRVRGTYVGDVLLLTVRLQPIDRALALASKLFVAVIPLSIILAAVVPGTDSFGETLVERFGLTGPGAQATEALFASNSEVEGGLTVFGLLVVVYSTLSFSKGLQRVYLDAWDLPPLGVEGLRRRAVWVVGFAVYLAVGAPIRNVARDNDLDILYAVAVLGLGAVLWVWTPYGLLGKRLPWRRLLPVGLLTAATTSAYGAISALYVPALFTRSAERYGLIGIAFSVVTWLFVYASVIVGSVILTAAYDRRRHGPPLPDAGTLFQQAVD